VIGVEREVASELRIWRGDDEALVSQPTSVTVMYITIDPEKEPVPSSRREELLASECDQALGVRLGRLEDAVNGT
jgi:hypothetical protein